MSKFAAVQTVQIVNKVGINSLDPNFLFIFGLN